MSDSPLTRDPIDSRHLRVFCTVADTGSLTKAAQRLCLTRTALSHALKALETDLGCLLFLRDRTGLKITDMGARLLPRANALLRAMQDVRCIATGQDVR